MLTKAFEHSSNIIPQVQKIAQRFLFHEKLPFYYLFHISRCAIKSLHNRQTMPVTLLCILYCVQ